MKQGIHPDYVVSKVTCSCGNSFTTRSIKPELHVELCNKCHPFYTGKQKLVDTGGRVERFQRKYQARATAAPAAQASPAPATEPDEGEASAGPVAGPAGGETPGAQA